MATITTTPATPTAFEGYQSEPCPTCGKVLTDRFEVNVRTLIRAHIEWHAKRNEEVSW